MRKQISAPAVSAVSLDEVKDQLRLERAYTAEDEYLQSLIDVAVNHVETVCGRALVSQTWRVYAKNLSDLGSFRLPFGKIQSVSGVGWIDSEGTEHAVDSSLYSAVTGDGVGMVLCDTDEISGDIGTGETASVWPCYVEFVCGYGDTPESIPASIRHALKLIVTDLYENREPVMTANVEKAIDRLLCNFRVRFFE